MCLGSELLSVAELRIILEVNFLPRTRLRYLGSELLPHAELRFIMEVTWK